MTIFIIIIVKQTKSGLTLIILLILIQITKQYCIRQSNNLYSVLKRNHQNVLSYQSGALISSKTINYFQYGNNGVVLRDEFYKILPYGVYFTRCQLGQSISIILLQKYLLTTLKIWFWEYEYLHNKGIRYYDIIVYAKLDQGKNKIYDSNLAISLMKIEFPEQFVEEFQIVNVGGNTYNSGLHIIKVEAYYKFS
ncbi:unnamed protein product [Paramecium pentaurelia]|uniref:Uncharacterized protein n=1 Tax=Paramecium pentaurelia TaxID=43138 RepID=A0A8S1YG08_9CILI|nr:unnamed protein product [Paramecium pentaurelia]